MNTSAKDIQKFVGFWTGKGYEKGQTQPFFPTVCILHSAFRILHYFHSSGRAARREVNGGGPVRSLAPLEGYGDSIEAKLFRP